VLIRSLRLGSASAELRRVRDGGGELRVDVLSVDGELCDTLPRVCLPASASS